jgi:hypothetical protein
MRGAQIHVSWRNAAKGPTRAALAAGANEARKQVLGSEFRVTVKSSRPVMVYSRGRGGAAHLSEIYCEEFPSDARARVEIERLVAYAELARESRGVNQRRREALFIRCVLRIFLAFVREACEFAKRSNHLAWSDRELDRRCREFLLEIFIDAYEDKAKDLGIRRRLSSLHGQGFSLDREARLKVEKSAEWIKYQELLGDALEAQSTPTSIAEGPGPLPEHEQADGTESRKDNVAGTEPLLDFEQPARATENGAAERTIPGPRGADPTSLEALDMTKHERRRAVVGPILKEKGWTVNKGGTQAGVGKNCAYEYLGGRRNLSTANRLALAQVLGLEAEDLPV